MRCPIFALLAVAATAFAAPQGTAYEITDGQVQAPTGYPPTMTWSSIPATSTVAPPPASTITPLSTVPPPAYTSSVTLMPATTPATSPVAPVATSSSVTTAPPPPPSYPVPGNSTITPPATSKVTSSIMTQVTPPITSSIEVSPTSTSSVSSPVHNVAALTGAKLGWAGAVFAGAVFLFA